MGEEIRWRQAPAPAPLKAFVLPVGDPVLVVSSVLPAADRAQAMRGLVRIWRDRRARMDMIDRQE